MLSVTDLCSYLYCSRKLYLRKVFKIYEPIKEVTFKGSFRHEIHDLASKADEETVRSVKTKLSLNEIKELYLLKYKEILRKVIVNNKELLKKFNLKGNDVFAKNMPVIEEEADLRATNVHKTIIDFNVVGDELWEKLTPKIISELRIEDPKLGLKGIIDQIYKYEEDLVPIELKTGKAPRDGVWPGHKIQIAAYALLLEGKFNEQIKEGFVHYLEAEQKRHIPINAFLRLEVKELINKVNTLIKSSEIPNFCGNDNKCRVCGLKETCYNQKEMNKLLKSKTLNIS
jgi:CRISPR-associated protein Cas4